MIRNTAYNWQGQSWDDAITHYHSITYHALDPSLPETITRLQAAGYEEFTSEEYITPFDDIKAQQKQNITFGFDNSLISKSTSYTTQGLINNITLNARERDLNNLEQLEKHMIDNNIIDTNFRTFDNSFVNLSLQDITQITKELRGFGLYLYQLKWTLEAQIDSIIEDTEENRNIISTITWNI